MKILCMGDSITAGIGGTVGNGYPDVMARILGKRHKDLTVINEGRPGDSTKDYFNYLETSMGTIENLSEIIGWFKPQISYDVIILMIGTNDCRTDNWVETEDSLRYIQEIVNMVFPWVKAKDDIILSSLIPLADPMPEKIVGGAHEWYQGKVEKELNPGIKAISEKMGLRYFDMYSVFKDGLQDGKDLYDGIHPYNKGYRLMGEAFARFLEEYFF